MSILNINLANHPIVTPMINKSFKKSITLFLVVLGGSVCLLQKGVTQPIETSLQERYRSAIRDAALVDEEGKDFDNLIQITPDNPFLKSSWDETQTRILVVTWKSQRTYDQYIKPFSNSPEEKRNKLTWVTVAPQVKEFCKQYLRNNPNATEADLNLRLKQYLGLDPKWNYDVFVELWVNPKDLFRPCVDPEITDTKCNRKWGDEIPKVIGATPDASISDYKLFFENLYYISIRPGLQPFTGLGYTYDWSSPNGRVGASEFILIPGAAYTINGQPVPTLKYCQS
uniref:Uncharacterized protein n=2 Tax=Gloeothece TaxID=28070 RepID=E0UIR0_GLOV7|nr:conserved hypothetical protein [Gloeothece verrucosa PCC 7822]